MIIFSPVSKFRIRYEVAKGQPYSHLDHMILKAIFEGITTQENLENIFQIHRRLIVQSLVTLTQAGWVAIGNTVDKQFVITAAGKVALKGNSLPSFIERKPKTFYVMLDQVSGVVIPENQVPYTAKRLLEERRFWDKNVALSPEVFDNKLDESEVIELLPRSDGRLHWVGPIEMVSKFEEYIIVEYDIFKGEIINLPSKLSHALEPYVTNKVNEIRHRRERATDSTEKDSITFEELDSIKSGNQKWSDFSEKLYVLDWNSEALLVGEQDHINIFSKALNISKSIIYIACTNLLTEKLEKWQTEIYNALTRGVDIHLLRGNGSQMETLNWVIDMALRVKSIPNSGKIITNHINAPSNARFLIWDDLENQFQGIIGSYDWMGDNTPTTKAEIGVYFQNVVLLSELARYAAGIWSGTRGESLSSVPDRWRRISNMLENQFDLPQEYNKIGEVKARLCLNRNHFSLRHRWQKNINKYFWIGTPFIDDSFINDIEVANQNLDDLNKKVIFGMYKFRDISKREILRENQINSPDYLLHIPNFAGRFLIADEKVCISSFNFSAYEFSKDEQIRELGIIVEGSTVIEYIQTRVAQILSE